MLVGATPRDTGVALPLIISSTALRSPHDPMASESGPCVKVYVLDLLNLRVIRSVNRCAMVSWSEKVFQVTEPLVSVDGMRSVCKMPLVNGCR